MPFNMKNYGLRLKTRKVQLGHMEAEILESLLMKSISTLCQQNISFAEVVHVEGSIVFTADKLDTLTVHLDRDIIQELAKPKLRRTQNKESNYTSTTESVTPKRRRGRPRKYQVVEEPSENVVPESVAVEESHERESSIELKNQDEDCEGVIREQTQVLHEESSSMVSPTSLNGPSATVATMDNVTLESSKEHNLKNEPQQDVHLEEITMVTEILFDTVDDNNSDGGNFGQEGEVNSLPIAVGEVPTSPSQKQDYLTLSDLDATKDPELVEELVLASLGPSPGSVWPDEQVWNYTRRPKLYQYDKQFQDACQAVKKGMQYSKASRKYKVPVSKLRYHINVREKLNEPIEKREDDKPVKRKKHGFHICEECGKTCISKVALKSHMTKHTGERPFQCHICNSTFSTKYILKAHLRRHDPNDKPHSCPYCDKRFLYRAEMSRHVIVHTGLKLYKCSICNQAFSKKSTLVNHQKRHTDERRYKCDQCGEAFISSQSLKRHLAKHNGVRNFACEQCLKKFWTPSDLKEHQKLHQNVKQHICSVCGMQFVRSNALTSHINWVHNEVRAFVCKTCDKTFKKKHALLKHERNHTGITPYICEVCGQGFKWHTSRKLHMKKHKLILPEVTPVNPVEITGGPPETIHNLQLEQCQQIVLAQQSEILQESVIETSPVIETSQQVVFN